MVLLPFSSLAAWLFVTILIIRSFLDFDPDRTTMNFYTTPWPKDAPPCLAFELLGRDMNTSKLTTMTEWPQNVYIDYGGDHK